MSMKDNQILYAAIVIGIAIVIHGYFQKQPRYSVQTNDNGVPLSVFDKQTGAVFTLFERPAWKKRELTP